MRGLKGRSLWSVVLVGTICGLFFLLPRTGAIAALESVADLFRQTDYEEARNTLGHGGEAYRPGEDGLWRSRLSATTGQAIDELNTLLKDKTLPEDVILRTALELSELEFARGGYAAAFSALSPLLQAESGNLPGEVYLRAGLCLRALGQQQRAREMLASVRPADPAFTLARYYLGDIGLERQDPVLAMRYFEVAAQDLSDAEYSRVAAGLWKALRDTDQSAQAQELLDRLRQQSPGCLALLEINHILRQEQEDRAVRHSQVLADTSVIAETPPVSDTGRYSIQLGAFSDRRLALEFLRRYQDDLPDLHIDQVTDDRGQFLYKVRCSAFVNPALARAEAQNISRRLDLPTLVVDTTE